VQNTPTTRLLIVAAIVGLDIVATCALAVIGLLARPDALWVVIFVASASVVIVIVLGWLHVYMGQEGYVIPSPGSSGDITEKGPVMRSVGKKDSPEFGLEEPRWPVIAGFCLLVLAIMFLMAVYYQDVRGLKPDDGGKVVIAIIVGLVLAGSFGFIGGTAKVSGTLPLPKLQIKSIHFSVTGAMAGFASGLLLIVGMFKLLS
jgi:hypothetical protein